MRNRAYPFIIKEYNIEGSYFNGRKTQDGYIYILARQNLYRRKFVTPWFDLGSRRKNVNINSIFYYPHQYKTPIFLNILSLNLKYPYSRRSKVISLLTEDAQQLYMSERHIYITFSEYKNGKTFTNLHKIYVRRNWIVPFADGEI